MGQLYFLIGLPRSGKSSFAQKWVENNINIVRNNCYTENKCSCYSKKNKTPRVIVCADDIRLACGHRWNGYIESYINATKLIMIRALLKKHDVLVDGTHTTTKSIIELLNIDKNAIPYIITTFPDECKIRAKATNQEDLYPIIDRMYTQLEELAGGMDPYWYLNILENIDRMRNNIQDIRISD